MQPACTTHPSTWLAPLLLHISKQPRIYQPLLTRHARHGVRFNHSDSGRGPTTNKTSVTVDNSASSKLFADAAKEETNGLDKNRDEDDTTKRVSKVSILEKQHENWTGDESIQDAVLRMLVDKYKPLRTGTIQTADDKLKKTPPKLSSASLPQSVVVDHDVSEEAEASLQELLASRIKASSNEVQVQPQPQPQSQTPLPPSPTTGSWSTEPLLPSTPNHQPWHTTFKTPSTHTEASIKLASIPTSSSKPKPDLTPLPVDDKARRLEMENRKRAQVAGRLTRARESTLDYALGIKGGGASGPSGQGQGVGTGRLNPVSVKGWTSLVEERIAKAKHAGVFNSVKGRGKPLLRTTEEHNPFIAREEFLMNRIVRRSGAAPPWVEIQNELDTAVSSFRRILRDAYVRRTIRILTLTHPFPTLLRALTLPQIQSHRDPEWLARESSYHDVSINQLNALVRKYNGLAPYAVRRPYYVKKVELERLYGEECAREILEGVRRRAEEMPEVWSRDGVGSRGYGGDDDGSGGGGGGGGETDPSKVSRIPVDGAASFISWIRSLFRRIFGGSSS